MWSDYTKGKYCPLPCLNILLNLFINISEMQQDLQLIPGSTYIGKTQPFLGLSFPLIR